MNEKNWEMEAPESDADTNDSGNQSFEQVLDARLSRRSVLKGSFGAAASAFFATSMTGAMAKSFQPLRLNFSPVAKNLADMVTVPGGYSVSVMYRLGDPIRSDIPDYRNDGMDTADSFAWRAGDHHDGMFFFGLQGSGERRESASNRGLLAINHEAITPSYLHPFGQTISGSGAAATRTDRDEVVKEFHAHGVSVIEVRKNRSTYDYVRNSPYNRRVTTLTDMVLSGPAAGTPLMVTAYSPNGTRTRGTVNNCASGYTPWGTYLTCEENWAGYFRRLADIDNPKRSTKELTAFARYGVAGNGRELWGTVTPADATDTRFSRWVAMVTATSADKDFRNVANTYGWNVEIDPYSPSSTPKKRTAMGRFAHEGAWVGPVVAGQPVVFYMGCDSRNEYIYKYVSKALWDPKDANGGLAAGDKYLDNGTLYAAKFLPDGTGAWAPLVYGVGGIDASYARYPFSSQADVLVHARLAADAVGATKMDRPEWGAVNPANGEVYMTLTNTNAGSRPLSAVDAANPRFYNDPKGPAGSAQRGNPNGHVIRWAEAGGSVAATSFKWDIFLFGARAGADAANVNISALTDANDFSSPDGLWFGRNGLLWIQTDDGAYTDVTNCMLLAAIPGRVGDGEKRLVVNSDSGSTNAVTTYVGAPLGESRLRRFLVGPKECEITGITETPDGKALFINIQHPGEDTRPDYANPASFGSHWPDGNLSRPRSATIVITRNDGGTIGADGML